MKKTTFLLMFVALSAMMGVKAQSFDTVFGRQPEYYYTYWYDTSLWYTHPDSAGIQSPVAIRFQHWGSYNSNNSDLIAQMNTSYPIRVKGVALMVSNQLTDPDHPASPDTEYGRVLDSVKMPEYVYLLQEHEETADGNAYYLSVIDSARWDTLQPKIYSLEATADGRYAPHCCYVYEVMFDTEHLVDGCFAIAGTYNSNTYTRGLGWSYFPTFYLTFGNMNEDYGLRPNSHFSSRHKDGADSLWCQPICNIALPDHNGAFFLGYGPFAAITEPVHVDLTSACPSCGTVEGMGVYPVGSSQTIRAIPSEEYHFSHWSDGDSSNPRTLVMAEDIALSAYFAKGTNGIGTTEEEPLFTLTPNPTTGKVTVTVAQPEPQLVLTLRDAAGHEVLRKELSTFNSQLSTTLDLRHLPAGAYFVTLTTPTASSTQRLVVK